MSALERVGSGIGERGGMAGDSAVVVVVVVGGVTGSGGVVPAAVINCWSDMFAPIAFGRSKGIGVYLVFVLCFVSCWSIFGGCGKVVEGEEGDKEGGRGGLGEMG